MSTNEKMQNLVKRGHMGSLYQFFFIFGIPLISQGRIKLETSNLAHIWTAVSTNEKNLKLGKKGLCGGHVTHFWIFGTPNISGTVNARNFKFGIEMDCSQY